MNIFEIATRNKLRFLSVKGLLSVEQLWDLPLTAKVDRPSLDGVAKSVNTDIKLTAEESFVTEATPVSKELEVKMEIVKHIIAAKKALAESNEKRVATAAKNKKILELIGDKEDEAMKGLSIEELKAQLSE